METKLIKKLETYKEKLEWRINELDGRRYKILGLWGTATGFPNPFALFDYLNPINHMKSGVLLVQKTYNQIIWGLNQTRLSFNKVIMGEYKK